MIRLLSIAILTLLLSIPIATQAQETAPTTVPQFLTDSWNTMIGSGLTNLAFTAGATYTPAAKEWGEFITLHRNLNIGAGAFVAPGVGVEHYASQWFGLQLQTSLGVNLTPLQGWTNVLGQKIGNTVFTPITSVGAEIPLGAGTDGAGGLGAFVFAGGSIEVLKGSGLRPGLELGGGVGTRTGLTSSIPGKDFNGKFYSGFASLLWKF